MEGISCRHARASCRFPEGAVTSWAVAGRRASILSNKGLPRSLSCYRFLAELEDKDQAYFTLFPLCSTQTYIGT